MLKAKEKRVDTPIWMQTPSIQFSCSVLSDSATPWTPRLSPVPRACTNSCPSSQKCHLTISFSVIPFSSWLQTFSESSSFPMSQFLHQVAKVLELQLQHQCFQWIFRTDFLWDWLIWSLARGSQESSPTPQFRNINSSTLTFLHSPTHTPIHDYWKNHSLD